RTDGRRSRIAELDRARPALHSLHDDHARRWYPWSRCPLCDASPCRARWPCARSAAATRPPRPPPPPPPPRASAPPATAGSGRALWGASPSDVWAVGEDEQSPLILHFDGASWGFAARPMSSEPFRAIWGTAPGDVWAGAGACLVDGPCDGALLHWDGKTWSVVD